jgi:cellobiose phosphorylase
MSLRRRVRLGPKEEVTIYFTTAFATSHEQALALAGKYSDAGSASRASELAWTDAQVELRHLGMSAGEAQSALRLASRLLYTNPDLRARPEVIARNRRGQSGLWAYGISGDLPIVVVRVSEPEHVPLVRQLLRAHGLWRLRGLAADLVVLNEHPTSYQQEVQEALLEAVRSSLSAHLLDNPGGVFVRRSDLMPEEDRVLLLTVARAILVGGRGTLAQQIERKPRLLNLKPDFTPRRAPGRFSSQTRPQPELDFFNGTGGFTEGGREYRIALADGQTTPAPWSNVVSNPGFGFVVTESGGGFTWAGNSRENRLTPWPRTESSRN